MKFITYIIFLFCPFVVKSQYYNVTHSSGTATVGGVNVTVTANNALSIFNSIYCSIPTGSYYMGSSSSATGYKYEFSPAVNSVRLLMGGQNSGEVITFFVNGTAYPLTSANISSFTGGCTIPGALTAISGNLEVTTGHANGQIDITASRIDSFRVYHNGSYTLAGTVYNLYFSNDTGVYISQYTDTMLCVGDTMHIPYTIGAAPFFTGNTFTFQLSSPTGSFATPTTLGTVTSTTGGVFRYVIPSTMTPGNNYRVRVLASAPTRTSADNGKDISIGVIRHTVSNNNNGPICSGLLLSLTASSSTTGVSYQWSGPSGFTSTLQNPGILAATVANSGDYIVTARLYGCIAKDTTNAIVVNTSATAAIATSNSPVCEKDSLYLYCTSSSTPNSYSWSGPGGFISSSKDTFISNTLPAMSGDYIVTAHFNACTVKDTVTVLVKPLPANRIINANTPVCTNETLLLNAGSSSSGTSYTWTGPLSFVSTNATAGINNPSTAQSGKYFVHYILNGCITKDSINVVVNPSPTTIIASANTTLCQNDTLRLNSTNSSTGVTWSWSGPAGYSSTSKDTFLANAQTIASGDYIVTAANSYNCKAKDTVTVLVKPLPANLNATTNAPICAGNTLTLNTTTTTSGVTFSWVGPASYTSTLQSPSIINAQPAATGSYIVTATLNGCSAKDTVVAIVNPLPPAPTPSANTPVCVGQDLMLNASTVPGATYQWTSTTGFSATTQNPVIAGATTFMAGKYYVRSMLNNCYSPYDSVTITVNPAPTINMYPSPKDSICQGANINFISNNSNAGTTYTRTWFKNNNVIGGAANANYNTSAVVDKDEFYVTITAYGVCATPYTDTSNKIIVHVLPWLAPAVSITANPNTTVPSGTMINFTATPINGGAKPAYQWTRNGANVVGALSNIWGASTLSNNDQICVDMTSNYLCPNPKSAKSNCIKVSIESTGIAHTWTGQEPKIYPNPVKDLLIIESIEKGTIIQLKDVIGRTMIDLTSSAETTTLNTSNLVPGTYTLLLYTQNGNSMVVKIVKE